MKEQGPLYIASSNANKIAEFQRLLGMDVIQLPLDIPEIQHVDPIEVCAAKAISAWQSNDQRPVLVEDTSLQIDSLVDICPPTFDKFFTASEEARSKICTILTSLELPRTAAAQVYFGIYDGHRVQTRSGRTNGYIADKLAGVNGFGWDDFFIPNGQDDGQSKTFAEMSGEEKDRYSMRRLALEALRADPFQLA